MALLAKDLPFLSNDSEPLSRSVDPDRVSSEFQRVLQQYYQNYDDAQKIISSNVLVYYVSNDPNSLKHSEAYLEELPNQWRISIKAEVDDLINEAGVENWDGEGAIPLNRETVELAKEIVDRLPHDIGKPDVDATAHGEVDFSWIIDKNVMFIISVGSEKEIVFVGLFHGTHIKGNETWNGILPEFVDCCFERLRKAQNL